MRARSLDEYRRKRDPARTPEPSAAAPGAAGPAAHPAQRFVVQQHAARRMHWDFRLEIDGVLVSWAVPRGPSVDPKEKRLAVQTEDHPLEYADFEGVIPPGNYGAGAVIVWDRGAYDGTGTRPADGLARGKLDLELQGHKLRGRWVLVRTKGGSGKDWLLFKKAEPRPVAAAEPVVTQPGSVLSGLTVEELRQHASRAAELAACARQAGAPRRALDAAALSPMLAATADRPFSRPGWLFELKHDGVRALAAREAAGRVRLFSRNRRDITAGFPDIALALAHLPCEAFIIDGEIVALDEHGASSFELLQRRLHQTKPAGVARAALEVPAILYGFDLLAVAGYDTRALPLGTRKELLRRLVPRLGVVRFSDHVEHDGVALFREANERALEGVIAKRAASRYASGRRSRDWLKIKTARTADLAIVGFLPGKGSFQALGSLMLAWRRDGELVYAGSVGSGLDARTIAAVLPRLQAARRPTPAFRAGPRAVPRAGVFVEPELVAEIRYREVTRSGYLRQPVFLRLRDEKRVGQADPPRAARAAAEPAVAGDERPAPVLQLTNVGKVFWRSEGYTKGDLLRYYEQAWPALEPYLRDRPVVLTRYPDGIDGKSFFQKNAPEFTPDWVPTHRIDDNDYFVCNELPALLYVINLGCIPLHIWSARCASIDRPDWAILDLDPKGAPFRHVVAVARQIHALLAPLGAPHFVKTSGQDGLHVLIPLGASLTHDDARTFAELLARVVTAERPDLATVARPVGARAGKVYVDFLQNGFGKTIAAPFSVRPRPGAPVSTPLEWREVNARLDPARFTIGTVPRRVRRRADPMRAVLDAPADVRAVLAALAQRIA